MDGHEGQLARLSHFVHKRFLWLMVGLLRRCVGLPVVSASGSEMSEWVRSCCSGQRRPSAFRC